MQQQIQHAVDQGTGAAVSAASAVGALVTAQNWALALFGVPLFVVLAGFAGVFYGLTFREPMRPVMLWANIILTTFLATSGGALLTAYWTLPPAALAGACAIAGFALQWIQPILKKHQERIVSGFLDKWFPPRPPSNGGQP